MCNIAGYVGTKQAAPILVDMMLRQEGVAGGYYTGISTVHEGKLYHAKITGDVQQLLEHFDVLNMPGTVGILHSRSKSGGGDEWAHPFIGCEKDGTARIAYVANGSVGFFKGREEENNRMAQELDAQGYRYTSRVVIDEPRYQTLVDGCKVHMSDVACQMILRGMHQGLAPAAAMEKCYCDMPADLVGLLLTLDRPDCIAYCATNMPMTVAVSDHGTYLSSIAFAHPADARYVQQLPMCAAGYVYSDHYTLSPFRSQPAPMADMDAQKVHAAYERIETLLKVEAYSYAQLRKALGDLYGDDKCTPLTRTIYEVLTALHSEGRLQAETRRLEGAKEGLTAPKLFFSLQ